MREARFYERMEDRSVRCVLCAHRCRIRPGRRGVCAVRENRDGTLFSLVHGRLVAGSADPIEKKPLFHFLPGSASYSIATVGCTFRCRHCQNAEIAQLPRDTGAVPGRDTSPEQVVERALARGCRSISYTYTEPTVFWEFVVETARMARERGLANVLVTNGYFTAEALEAVAPFVDAANVDLKGTDAFYRSVCGARAGPVVETLGRLRERGIWVEATTLLIPGLNDGPDQIAWVARTLASVDPEMPWHVSAFHPSHRMLDRPPTPAETIERAAAAGRKAGLAYVYPGNLPGHPDEGTVCPGCGRLLIARAGYRLIRNVLRGGRCPDCAREIPGRWD